MDKHLQIPVFGVISEITEKTGQPCFVIGGFVRDILLNRPTKDIDIVVLGSGIDLARQVAKQMGNRPVNVYKNFGTALVNLPGYDVEFVGARKESYRKDSRKPLVEDGTLEDDQNRRDFTINALAISLNKTTWGKITDPFHGIKDLKKKIIRTPLEPGITFSDDPLRMMRAIRFAAQLGFTIEERTFQAIAQNAERIKIISKERIIDEFNKIMESAKPSTGLLLLEESGLLKIIFPELQLMKGIDIKKGKAHKDNFLHTIQVVDNLAEKSPDLWLRWSGLLHDIAKPQTKRWDDAVGWTFHGHEFIGAKMVPNIFRKLKLPLGNPMKYVQKMVLLHLRPIVLSQEDVTDSAIRRLLYDAGNDIDDLMMLCEADITSKNEEKIKRYLSNFRLVRKKLIEIEEKDAIRNFQPPISGELIMETFDIKPGREVGMIKNAIKDAILDGIIHNDYDEAYRLMIQKGKDLDLKEKTN